MAIRYRPEIDGLRTVAVVSVLVYHLKLPLAAGYDLFAGGYLGVDVFFAVSGFPDHLDPAARDRGRGDFLHSPLLRAARTAHPACAVPGPVPHPGGGLGHPYADRVHGSRPLGHRDLVLRLQLLLQIALGAYGATEADYQPLLHTWTLGVEEQFYIFFPLLLLLIFRFQPRRLARILAMLMVVGFVGCQIATAYRPSLSFYWLPTRGWELLAGSWLAALSLSHPGAWRSAKLVRMMPVVGLALLLVSILAFPLDTRLHPGLLTLPVIAGTCAIIWWADPSSWAIRLLSTRPLVAVGRISYSLYLWHYPIFALGRELVPIPGLADFATWLALSFAGAALSYRFVEKPFREKGRIALPSLVRGFSACALVLCACVWVIVAGSGWEQRFPRTLALYGPSEMDNNRARDRSWIILDALSPGETIGGWSAIQPSQHELRDNWFKGAEGRRRYLLVGNSHSKDTFNALYLNRDLFPQDAFARYAMTPSFMPAEVASLRATPNYTAANEIVITDRFSTWAPESLTRFIRTVEADGKAVTILGPAVEFETLGDTTLFDWYLQAKGAAFDAAEIDGIGWNRRVPEDIAVQVGLQDIARQTGARLLWKEAYTCNSRLHSCALATPEGRKVFFDYSHTTLDGARYFGRRMAELGWFQSPRPG